MIDEDMKKTADELVESQGYTYKFSIVKQEPSLSVFGNDPEVMDKAIDRFIPVFRKWKEALQKASDTRTDEKAETEGVDNVCVDCKARMVYKEGVGAKGKWKAFFCPNNVKEDRTKHKPIWL